MKRSTIAIIIRRKLPKIARKISCHLLTIRIQSGHSMKYLCRVLIYSIIGPYRKGCGFSSIYFSFVSIYFSILLIRTQPVYYKLLYAIIPIVFLYITNLLGNMTKAHGHTSNYIHLLSIIYGYIIGVVEGFIELCK